ncbi:pyruvate dehydrogenase complex dihydrolipoamide acetyltransferase [Catalinimonas niigatensis]|uniref:pyruvate dehydrogenase complex dihydrolipoamide acetyltransferase n=1 Tax=Catalinimonas niigatensis TaxID=1397264 RepID=UPI0026650DB0|nr:pyruvate dehydrogenase complex dihydrolipoamide acetyltransferase [Catalinimonas niigatensis]WPP51360.1 pyruvate dehydrogenase complex dihydrolipoamide acetyltransferase [Catalinimonas niigatensis]
MAEVIRMPKMSDTMEEGVIASWQKKVGDKVESGDILAEVETDKATMELESFEDGTLLYIGVKENEAVPVDGVIAIIGEEGEDIDSLLKQIENGDSPSKDKEEEKSEQTEDKKENKESELVDASDVKATVVTMPKMSDTMTEGVIASWLKKVGDKVESGDILAEVETDKATMELESYEDGTLLYVGVEEGGSVEIDGVIAVIGEEGADYEKLLKARKSKKSGAEAQESKSESSSANGQDKASADSQTASKDAPAYTPTHAETASSSSSDGGRIKASPLARKMAEDKGFDIAKIPGSGENGRIVKKDIESYKPSAQPVEQPAATQKDTAKQAAPVKLPEVVGEERYEEVNVSQMRKTIARRLAESKFTAPHFYLTMEINMEKAIAARESMNQIAPVKISFNDIVVKAAAAALRQHPKVNVSWRGDKMRFNQHIHIGIAVAVDEGLLVPVIRFADNKTLSHISVEVKELAGKAKNKQLQPKDWEGSTFTISNLGMFGIEEFTAIINPPDACIMAVGGIKETPVVKDGQIVPGNVMKVTLSCDHRAVDGALGAAFLQTFKSYMEDPIRILI